MTIRNCTQEDFFNLWEMDWGPLPKERDTLYLIWCVDHSELSFVAEDEAGGPLGVLLASRSANGRSCFLNHLLVSSNARGQGVGAALVKRLKDICAALGVQRIWFFTGDKIRPFYEKLGFQVDTSFLHPQLAAYTTRHKGLTMTITLAPSD